MNARLRLVTLCGTVAGLLTVASAAAAPAAPAAEPAAARAASAPTAPAASVFDPVKLDPVAKGLTFGGDVAHVEALFAAYAQVQAEPRLLAAIDLRRKDEIRQETQRRIKAFSDGLKKFERNAAGYAVTVLADEYVPGVGQVMLDFQEGTTKRYYIFHNGQLWKYILSVEEPAEWDKQVERITGIFGKPTRHELAEVDNYGLTQGADRAVWETPGDALTLVAEDRMRQFQCHKLVWVSNALEAQVAPLRKPKDGGDVADFEDILSDIKRPGGEDPSNAVEEALRINRGEPPAPKNPPPKAPPPAPKPRKR